MLAVLKADTTLGKWQVSDHLNNLLFTVETAMSGRMWLSWNNWESSASGIGRTLEEALAGGLVSCGLDSATAAREATSMVKDYSAIGWEITEEKEDPSWPAALYRHSRDGLPEFVDRFPTREDAQLYVDTVTARTVAA